MALYRQCPIFFSVRKRFGTPEVKESVLRMRHGQEVLYVDSEQRPGVTPHACSKLCS